MGGEADTLRMVAELVDKFGAPLRDLQRQLRGVHREVTEQNRVQRQQSEQAHKAYESMTRTLRESVNPALTAVGITTLSLGGAISAVGYAVTNFSKSTYGLTLLSHETGLATEELRRLEIVAGRVQVAPDSLRASATAFSTTMTQLRRGVGEAAKFFESQPQLLAFGQRLKDTSDNAAALKMVFDELQRIHNPADQRSFLGALGLDTGLARLSGHFRQFYDEARKTLDALPKDAEKNAAAFEHAFQDMQTSVTNFKNTLGADFLQAFTGMSNAVTTFFQDPDVKKGFSGILSDLRELKPLLDGIAAVFGAIRTSIEFLDAHTPGGLLGDKNPDQGAKSLGDLRDWYKKNGQPAPLGQNYLDRLHGAPGPSFLDGLRGQRGDAPKGQDGVKDSVKKGSEEGVGNALREFFNRSRKPISLDPDAEDGGGLKQFGGGRYRMFAPGGPGNAIRASLGGGGTAGLGSQAGGGGRDVPTGPGGGPSGLTGSKQKTAAIVAEEWRKAGMSDNGIRGLMANIQDESSFNPTLRHPDQPKFGGEAHFAHGLYQEGGTEWNRYDGWLKKNYPGQDWRDPKLQSEFAAWNLKTNYPSVWKRMNEGSAGEAGAAYVQGYLKPAAGHQQSRSAKYRRGVPPISAYTGGERADGVAPNPQTLKSAWDDRAIQGLRDAAIRAAGSEKGAKGDRLPMNGLMDAAKKGGAFGPAKVEGGASLKVDFSNMPKGTRTWMKTHGIFDDVEVNKGTAMKRADE